MSAWKEKYKISLFKCGLVLLLLCGPGLLAANPVKDIDKKIKSNQQELDRLHEQIRDLETEKGKLKREENNLIKTIKKLDSEISQSVKKQVQLNRQLKETENRLKRIEGDISLYSSESVKWEGIILNHLTTYYIENSADRLVTDPIAEYGSRANIALKFSQMRNLQTKKEVSVQKEKEFLRSKEKLVKIQEEYKEEAQKQKRAQSEKQDLYKTTLGKRIIAEQQAQQLRETAESLEKLITQLTQKKERTLAAQKEAEQLKKSFQQKQKALPWPVQGSVIAYYGRQQHPELNITVVNNGVRIKTAPGAAVKAVEKGTVMYAADFRSYGQTIILDHGGDTYSIYGLLGVIEVKEGDKVVSGKVIGNTSTENPSQLYFELRIQGHTENPLLWLVSQKE